MEYLYYFIFLIWGLGFLEIEWEIIFLNIKILYSFL
jgi:hypothetical protein